MIIFYPLDAPGLWKIQQGLKGWAVKYTLSIFVIQLVKIMGAFWFPAMLIALCRRKHKTMQLLYFDFINGREIIAPVVASATWLSFMYKW